jgi:hypothetical protein
MGLVFILSLFALPVTTALVIAGKRRCLDCRHRFAPALDTTTGRMARFPLHLHFLNAFLLFLLFIVGPSIIRFTVGGVEWSNAFFDLNRIFSFGFFLWGSLFYHFILHNLLRRRIVRPAIWAALFLLPAVILGGPVFYISLPKVDARSLLSMAELAPLPKSATGVRTYSWASPFSGEDFVCFKADPNDIERFIAESPALQGQTPKRYSAEKMRLMYPKDYDTNRNFDDVNEYVSPRPSFPIWYKREVRGPARKYHVQPPRYQYPGEVLVDDETNTVYVYLIFS